MKIINKFFILLFSTVIIFSCGSNDTENNNDTVEVSPENLTVVDYSIEGMVCAMGCAATIEKDVVGMSGVVVSLVDYETGKAHFEFDNSIVSEKEIIAKIEGLADGQYKVNTWVEKELEEDAKKEEVDETENNEKPITEVSLPSFEMPNLFELLLDQI